MDKVTSFIHNGNTKVVVDLDFSKAIHYSFVYKLTSELDSTVVRWTCTWVMDII